MVVGPIGGVARWGPINAWDPQEAQHAKGQREVDRVVKGVARDLRREADAGAVRTTARSRDELSI